jgi:hypothetical protein
MSSSLAAALIGLGGVIIGGAMTAATTWWQSIISRKGRLTELEIQLRHERFLRDETIRRSAMLELAYAFRRFDDAAYEACKHHEHNQKMSVQLNAEVMTRLIATGREAIDLLNKNGPLINARARNEFEYVRDRWEDIYSFDRHIDSAWREDPRDECCILGGDFNVLQGNASRAVHELERQLDAMRFD